MITRVQAKNFKSFREIDVDLGPLTVFVGRNASGKSNFVDILRFVRDSLTKGLDAAITDRGGLGAMTFKQGSHQAEDLEIAISTENSGFDATYILRIGASSTGGFVVLLERAEVRIAAQATDLSDGSVVPNDPFGFIIEAGEWKQIQLFSTIDSTLPVLQEDDRTELYLPKLVSFNGHMRMLLAQLTEIDAFHFFPNAFRLPQQIAAKPFMNDEGHRFSSALKRRLEDKFDGRILSALSYVVEDVSALRVQALGSYLITEIEHRNPEHRNGSSEQHGTWIDLAHESDGTLRVLGLLVGLYQDQTEGKVLAFEEPEISIHIGALDLFYGLFDEAALTRQIIVTTHSPDFIAKCKVKELRVVERVDGESKIGRLLESQVKAINDQLFMASDLIRIEGLRREGEEVEDEISAHA